MSAKPARAPRTEGPEAFTPHRPVRAAMDKLAAGRSLPKGTVLFQQGDASRGVYVLHSGKARLNAVSESGRQFPYRTVGPGYVLGLPGTILNIPYLFTAELLQRCEVAFIPRLEMLDFLRRRADLCFDVVQQLGGELVEMPPLPGAGALRRRRTNA